jgi:hypothetical protein
MSKSALQKLDDALAKEEQFIAAAVAKSLTAYNKNPTGQNLRDYQANKKALDEYRAKASGKEDDHFATKGKVLIYLEDADWDVKKSKLYTDLKSVPKTKGGYLKKDIDMYAKLRLTKANGAGVGQDNAEKTRQEIRVAAARAEKLEMENEILRGRYLLKSEVEMLLAARAKVLYDGVKSFGVNMSSRMVDIVKGDQSMTPDLIELYKIEIETLFDHYSRPMGFTAPAIPDEEEED